jgi:hypothetical protein
MNGRLGGLDGRRFNLSTIPGPIDGDGKEVSFYGRRRPIIGEIRRLARRGGEALDLTAAAEELEARRRQAGLSLTRLNEQLRRPQGREENITRGRSRGHVSGCIPRAAGVGNHLVSNNSWHKSPPKQTLNYQYLSSLFDDSSTLTTRTKA